MSNAVWMSREGIIELRVVVHVLVVLLQLTSTGCGISPWIRRWQARMVGSEGVLELWRTRCCSCCRCNLHADGGGIIGTGLKIRVEMLPGSTQSVGRMERWWIGGMISIGRDAVRRNWSRGWSTVRTGIRLFITNVRW